jgi:CRISPR system Cascade subunit CasA
MNLVTSRWLAVRRSSGERVFVAPAEIFDASDPVVALDFPRPDWNAAIAELMIGMATLAFRPRDARDWRSLWEDKPTAECFAAELDPYERVFELLGPGPRAFQDLDELTGAEEKDIAQLLIDAPGSNALKLNTDLFNKRGRVAHACLPFAAASLVTLQTYAPSGGAGHRTSMRGGGPMTTIVRPARDAPFRDVVLANLPLATLLPSAPISDYDVWAAVFPWLAPCKTSERGRPPFGPGDGHQLQSFFATPRRIRFCDVSSEPCAFGGPDHFGSIANYRTATYGVNYEGWRHPLSPYRHDRSSGVYLPLHPRAGGGAYRDWLGLWASGSDREQFAAETVRLWTERSARANAEPFWIDAVGYAMDNMKPLSWTQARVPTFAFPDEASAHAFFSDARALVAGADEAVRALQFAGKVALHGSWNAKDQNYRIPDTIKNESVEDLSDALWRETEAAFEARLRTLASAPGQGRDALVQDWARVLKDCAMALFEARVGGDEAFTDDPKRLVFASHQLAIAFTAKGKVGKALNLPEPDKKSKEKAA